MTRPGGSLTRICYVIPSLRMGGTERQLLYLLKGLIRDHELTVVCTHDGGALVGDARRIGAYVHELRSWGGWDFTLFGALRKIFRSHRPDVVHTFLFGFDLAANRAARDTGVPVVISSRRELATWQRRRHIRAQCKANEYVDAIVANSRAVAEFAAKQEGIPLARIHVIPNGVDADAFVSQADLHQVRLRYKIPFHTEVIGMVANFSPVKDHDLFLAIAEEVMRRRPGAHFLLVGSGPRRKEIASRISKSGWDDRFTLTTTIEEIPDLYKLMNVSVLCSQVEGFPNAIIEAMAAGKPVVAASVGGIPELVADGITGKLVASRNPADYADALDWVLDHPGESAAMGVRAAEFVRANLSVASMVATHRTLYAELLVQSIRRGA
ncbi:MAG: glycosyltransferase [Candidatus Hydrogenedentes bacterium]|nr:glycosyltransferase [Candidatus Hydrogenedentota bacterium]